MSAMRPVCRIVDLPIQVCRLQIRVVAGGFQSIDARRFLTSKPVQVKLQSVLQANRSRCRGISKSLLVVLS
jgi:hypothetical protein